jgi:hypothetical protein
MKSAPRVDAFIAKAAPLAPVKQKAPAKSATKKSAAKRA